jgi:type IV fimbrial biogenesis protein FimT
MKGFTIIELMVTVTIFAVLIAAALPAYNDFVRNQRVKTASFDLFSSLVQARSEALTRNTTITVTPMSPPNWASGWEVKVGTTVLRKQEALSNLTMRGMPEDVASISFNGSGRVTATLNRGIQISATGTSITTRCIKLDLSGRPLTRAEAC